MEADNDTVQLIYKIANHLAAPFKKFGTMCDREDLIQIAVLAGLSSLERYDASQGKLGTFLYSCMNGAIKEELRQYIHARCRKNNWYKDGETIRFSSIANSMGQNSQRGAFEDSVLGFDFPDKKTPDSSKRLEIYEELAKWRRENWISSKEWLILMLRIGENLPQYEVGQLLGLTCRNLTCSSLSQIEKKLFARLGLNLNLRNKSSYTPKSSTIKQRKAAKNASRISVQKHKQKNSLICV